MAVLRSLNRSNRHLRILSLLELGCATPLFPLALREGGAALILAAVPAAGLYLYGWTTRHRRAVETAKVLRHEELFLTQSLDPLLARRCIQGQHHLWSGSLLREALRGSMARPFPTMLTPSERAERLRPYFDRALAGLIPKGYQGLEWLLPVAAAVKAVSSKWPTEPAGLLPPGAAALLLAGFGAFAVAQLRNNDRMRRRLADLGRALGAWAEQARLYNVLFDWRKLHALVLHTQVTERH